MQLALVLSRGAIVAALITAAAASAIAINARADDATVITLTQTGCQFVEPEGVDRGFVTARPADCEKINSETGAARAAHSTVLELKPGAYIFRVTNVNVPYRLGFWIRESDYEGAGPIKKFRKTSVTGRGLVQGVTKDHRVELKEGEYLFSCPANPTPNYRVVVKG
jgi:hypothetical protein